jgi:hypothetical protein
MWASEDAAGTLGPRNVTAAARYVVITVTNQQTRPAGVASKIKIKTRLWFGAPDDVAPHPYYIERMVEPAPLQAQAIAHGALFNVGGLANFIVAIEEVEYYDILSWRRTAAVGTGYIRCVVSGELFPINRVFEPRKGEFSSGV